MANSRIKKRNAKLIGLLAVILALAVVILVSGALDKVYKPNPNQEPTTTEGTVTDTPPEAVEPVFSQVHYIDVGQGDSELIIADNGTTMLIDGGEREYADDIEAYLNNLGISRLDYILVSHPHSDHMGGLINLIKSNIEVGKVLIPSIPEEFTPTTKVYEDFLYAVLEKGCELAVIEAETISFGGGEIQFIPSGYSGKNMNNYSPIVRYVYQGVSFMFAGDMEKDVEKELVNQGLVAQTDVLKASHHGSSTSSRKTFVDAVSPTYVVICVGADNSYNHPNSDIVARLSENSLALYRTDVHGNVVATVQDGEITFATER